MTESQPDTLSLSVHETVNAKAVGMGGQAPAATPTPVDINKEQLVADGKKIIEDEVARYQETQMKYISRYVKPHKTVSRFVTEADLEKVHEEAKIMLNLCFAKHGVYGNANAIAHSQIEDKEPLRFFVMNSGMVVINPVIISHSQYPVFKDEGCMSFPEEPIKTMLKRFNKITVRYQTFSPNPDPEKPNSPIISKPAEATFKGMVAEVFQHECAHLNGHYVYDEDYDPLHAIGYGDGTDVSKVHLVDLMTEENQDETQSKA